MAWINRLGLSALVFAPVVAVAQQPTGTITGRVVDRASQQPVVGATVRVVGTTRGAQTSDSGTYRITGVPAGAVNVQALRIGYASITRPLTLTAAGTSTVDFTMEPAATTLDVVQVTATGQEQSRRESGVSTANINVPEQVPQAAVSNLQTVLSSRAAGVTVQEAGGTTGAAARIRIRGSNSVSLSNDPLVIVDGIRVNNDQGATSIGVGGQVPSRLNDLNPEDIENVEIVKGPAAAALYGTAASNGVIQITTKRGRAGRAKWATHTEAGTVNEVTSYPANYWTLDLSSPYVPAGDTLFPCTLDYQAQGFCSTNLKVVSFNPLEQTSPFIRGWRERYGVDVNGGSDAAQYFVGGDFYREQGVYEINRQRLISLRGNIHSQLRDNLDLSVNTGYAQSRLRVPQNDNNIRGILPDGLLGVAIPNYGRWKGWSFDSIPDLFAINSQQNVDRFTGSSRANWQPRTWLSAIGTAGVDFTNRIDQEFIPPITAGGPTSMFADDRVGKRTSNPFQDFVYTANLGVIGTFNPRSDLRSQTSTGVQWNDEITRATLAFGQNIVPGSGSLNGTTALFAVGESNVEVKTLGTYLQEQLAWRERLFLTGALRADKNSAFGQNFKSVVYPAASLSWVVGEEGFFPKQDYVSSLRLRSAYGESGQRPRFRDAVRFLTPAAVTVRKGTSEATSVPGFFVGGIGNPNLKPEISKEYELGFDMGFLRDKIATEITYYSKTTQNAIVARPIPLSEGEATSRLENIGRVKNAGLEYSVNAQLFDVRNIEGSLTLTGSKTANKLLGLGQGIPPIIFGADNVQRHQPGYALGGYWEKPIVSYSDKNGDGMLSRVDCPGTNCEVVVGDSAVFIGSPFPTSEVSFTPQLTLFKNITVRALFDHRGGQKLLNFTDRFRDVSFGNSFVANDKSAPLDKQARYIAGLEGTDYGYIEDASFTKWRELSIAFGVPQRYVSRFGFSGATLTLAGRNLHTWTKYTGLDPEINENGGFNFSTDEFLSQPQVRYYTIRLDLGW